MMSKQDLINEILGEVNYMLESYPVDEENDDWLIVHRTDYSDDMRIQLEALFNKYDLYIKLKED